MIQRLKNRQKGGKEKRVRRESCSNFLCVDNNFLELIKQCILHQDVVLNKYVIWLKCSGDICYLKFMSSICLSSFPVPIVNIAT